MSIGLPFRKQRLLLWRISLSPRELNMAGIPGQYKIWTAGYGLRTTDYGLRTTDYGLRTTDYGLGIKHRLGSYLVTHPYTIPAEQGLTLLSRPHMLLSFWYSGSTVRVSYEFLFSFSSNYLFSTFPAMQYQISFSLFDTYSHLRNSHRGVTIPEGQGRTATCVVGSTELSPVRRGQYLGG